MKKHVYYEMDKLLNCWTYFAAVYSKQGGCIWVQKVLVLCDYHFNSGVLPWLRHQVFNLCNDFASAFHWFFSSFVFVVMLFLSVCSVITPTIKAIWNRHVLWCWGLFLCLLHHWKLFLEITLFVESFDTVSLGCCNILKAVLWDNTFCCIKHCSFACYNIESYSK